MQPSPYALPNRVLHCFEVGQSAQSFVAKEKYLGIPNENFSTTRPSVAQLPIIYADKHWLRLSCLRSRDSDANPTLIVVCKTVFWGGRGENSGNFHHRRYCTLEIFGSADTKQLRKTKLSIFYQLSQSIVFESFKVQTTV